MGAVLGVAVSSLEGDVIETELNSDGVVLSKSIASDQKGARDALKCSRYQDYLRHHQISDCLQHGMFQLKFPKQRSTKINPDLKLPLKPSY